MSSPGELLARVEAVLEAAGIPHMVVGSFASSLHGVPRTTQDLDIVIDPSLEQLELLLAALDPKAYYLDPDVAREALRRRSMFNVIEIESAWKIDLVIRRARPFSIEELRRRETLPLLGVRAPVATAEDTIIAKLEWARDGGSERQLDDAAAIVRVRGATLDRAYIERWVTELGLEAQWARAR